MTWSTLLAQECSDKVFGRQRTSVCTQRPLWTIHSHLGGRILFCRENAFSLWQTPNQSMWPSAGYLNGRLSDAVIQYIVNASAVGELVWAAASSLRAASCTMAIEHVQWPKYTSLLLASSVCQCLSVCVNIYQRMLFGVRVSPYRKPLIPNNFGSRPNHFGFRPNRFGTRPKG